MLLWLLRVCELRIVISFCSVWIKVSSFIILITLGVWFIFNTWNFEQFLILEHTSPPDKTFFFYLSDVWIARVPIQIVIMFYVMDNPCSFYLFRRLFWKCWLFRWLIVWGIMLRWVFQIKRILQMHALCCNISFKIALVSNCRTFPEVRLGVQI